MPTNLKDLAQWLARVESLAMECYQRAGERPGFGSSLVAFLEGCAEDEAWHLNALKKAGPLLEGRGEIPSDLEVDARTLERIEAPFRKVLNREPGRPVSEREVLDCIATAEFSEWNHVFIYLMSRIAQFNGQLLYPAARIQSHLGRIIEYFELIGYEHESLRRLKTLPRVWEESILVVDDEAAIRELVAGILQTQGRVDQARDGAEALELLQNRYYRVIISDLEMPGLDGLEFFRRARELHPRIAPRFIFLSASPRLFEAREPGLDQATLLRKPFRSWELIDKVKERLAAG